MSIKKIPNLPSNLPKDTMFTLCDSSWSVLFPTYWQVYRKIASFRNVAKFKVVTGSTVHCVVEMMDIAPEFGRVVVPVGMRVETEVKQIQALMIVSHNSRLT